MMIRSWAVCGRSRIVMAVFGLLLSVSSLLDIDFMQ